MQLQDILENVWIWAAVLLLLIALSALVVISIRKQQNEKARAVVKANSTYYNRVKELNKRYTFREDIPENGNITFYESEKTKAKFDKRQLEDILYERIKEDPLDIGRALRDVEANRETYRDYESELHMLHSEATESDCKRLKIPYKRFLMTEQEMVREASLKPVLAIQIECRKEYISPAGRNEYWEECTFYERDIRRAAAEIGQDTAVKNSEEYRRKAERRRVTDRLRYQIIRRDGFRCQLCGASQADGVKLHVDHIIPISKGGTSDERNLRTLCDRCNLGKGDLLEDEP